MRTETIAEQIFFTTAFIVVSSPTVSMKGTGFVYRVDVEGGSALFLATNRHLVKDFTNMTIKFVADDGTSNAKLGEYVAVEINDLQASGWVGHPNNDVDVAIVPIAHAIEALQRNGKPAFFKSLTPEIVFEIGVTPDLSPLEEITFVGYPEGLFDETNHLPIVRRGMTATPIEVDFNGLPSFIIDAGVYQGSSGSPVFILNQGWVIDRLGNATLGNRAILLGIVAANYHRYSEALVQEQTGKFSATFREAIGLGVVFKAKCVDECADIYLVGKGYKRIPTAVPLVDSGKSESAAT